RKSGAAKPASTIASPKSGDVRSDARVHASSVCASIITRTAMPRAQSMLTDLRAARSGLAGNADVRCHLEIDVRIQRMPDRTVLFPRQPDRSSQRLCGHGPFDV